MSFFAGFTKIEFLLAFPLEAHNQNQKLNCNITSLETG